jgi:amino acid transporter
MNLFIRIIAFYELGVIFITVLVPYNDSRLLGTSTVASSPFVIAMVDAGVKGLPDMMNAIILLGLAAIGAESMYISSRALVAMAQMNMAPKIFARVDKKGRPRWSLIVTAIFATIFTYINCSSTGGVIFTWFSSVSATVYFMSWMCISISNIQMHKAIKLQGDNVWTQPHAWKLRGFPLTAIFLFVTSFLVLFGTGYVSLFPIGGAPPSAETFFETFLGVPIWIVCYLGYKLYFKTKIVDPATADLKTGRMPLTEEDIAFFDRYYAQPLSKRVLSYVRF